MSYNCLNILKWTEAQLKYTYDVSPGRLLPRNCMRRWARLS